MSKHCCGTEGKKEKVMGCCNKDAASGQGKGRGKGAMLAVFIGVIAALAVASYIFRGGAQGIAGAKEVEASDGAVRIQVSQVSDGKAHFYSYKAGDKTVKFFVVKSSDGVIRAAFDACDVCFPSKLGYRQEGDFMVCNNCNQRFPSVSVNEIKGGCNPSPIARTIEGGAVVLRVSDLNGGAGYF